MFKSTINRHLEAVDIAAAARTFKENVQQALQTLLKARLREGEDLPDTTFLQELLARLLDESSMSLLEVDNSHTKEMVAAAELRQKRDELTENLRLRLQDVRYLLDRNLEPATAKAALRERRLSRAKPNLLTQGARQAAATLREPKFARAAGPGEGSFLSAAEQAAALEADAAALEAVLERLSPQKKTSELSLAAKVADLNSAVDTTRRCSEFLFGLYRLAGLDFHAERLRKVARKKKVETPEKAVPPGPPAPVAATT